MIETRHVATTHDKPINGMNSNDKLYCGNTLKEACEQLNSKFVDLKKSGEKVVRISISEFKHFKE